MHQPRRGLIERLESRRLLAAISSNQSIQANITAAGQVDEYTFSANAGDAIVAAVGDVLNNAFAPALELRDPLNAQLAIDVGAVAASFSATATVNGVYKLRVSDSALTNTGTYLVTVVRAPAIQATGEEAFNTIASNIERNGTVTPGDLDAYTFTATAGATLHVALTDLTNSTFSPLVRVFRPDGALLTQYLGGLVAEGVTAGLPQTGTYTIVAQDLGANDSGAYRLSLAMAPATQAASDDGGALVNNVSKYGQLSVGDLDVFTFTATAGRGFIVSVGDITAGPITPTIDVYDPNGVLVGGSTGVLAASVALTAPLTGTYTVVVRDSGLDDAGPYRIHLAIAGDAIVADPIDPDAGNLAPGQSRRGHISIGDLDIYHLSLGSGQTAFIDLGDIHDVAAAPELRVYDPSGTLLASDTDGTAAEVVFTASAGGVYTVIVSELNRDEAYRYSLVAAVVPANNNGDQWDIDFGTVNIGESRLGFTEIGDVDVYSLLVPPSQAVSVSLKDFTGSTLSPQLDVYSATGSAVGSDDDPTEAIVSFGNGPASQTYYVVVRDLGSNDYGAYSLSINTLTATTDLRNPVLVAGEYLYNQPAPNLVLKFSESVGASLSLADVTLTNRDTNTPLSTAGLSLAWKPGGCEAVIGFAGLPGGVLPDANYRITLNAAGVTDPSGNPLSGSTSFDFYALAADFNRDRVVDITDLALLATAWQTPGRTFAEGNVNYDLVVDITDLAALATNWQKTLPAPAPSFVQARAIAKPSGQRVADSIFSTAPI